MRYQTEIAGRFMGDYASIGEALRATDYALAKRQVVATRRRTGGTFAYLDDAGRVVARIVWL